MCCNVLCRAVLQCAVPRCASAVLRHAVQVLCCLLEYQPHATLVQQVRPADPQDAWMGGPAPANPALDAVAYSSCHAAALQLPGPNCHMPDTLMALPSSTANATNGRLAPKGQSPAQLPLSFRSLFDALAVAADGDVITLLPGVHNVSQGSLTVAKRVAIIGQGRLGDVRLDHRANVPLFRLER